MASACRQSGMPRPTLLMVACETMASVRERSSPSKPFITEITVMSAVMPITRPSIDTMLMNEMK